MSEHYGTIAVDAEKLALDCFFSWISRLKISLQVITIKT
jgi:hypothetical protein